MDIKNLLNKVSELIRKYRYVMLVLLIGIVLMLLPSSNDKNTNNTISNEINAPQISIDKQIEDLLSFVDGAGKVKVFLALDTGEEVIYQTDQNITSSENSNSTQSKTVIIQNAERDESGLVRQINPASYKGAVVVCEGADSSTVRLAIIEAVSNVTGLRSDRISVLKMK